ncbi:hypothetical protein JQC72_15985, partial [Polycladomyces sp. WAk]
HQTRPSTVVVAPSSVRSGCAVFFFVYLELMISVVWRWGIINPSAIGSLIMWGGLLIAYLIGISGGTSDVCDMPCIRMIGENR